MLKLIRKDYIAFGRFILFQSIFMLTLISIGIFIDHEGNLTFIALIMYPLIIPTYILLSDKKYITLCNTLPCSRKEYVLSKYIGGFIASFAIITIGLLYGYITTTFVQADSVNFGQIFSLRGFSFIIIPIIWLNSLTFPIFFRFSKDKGSIVLVLLFCVLLGGFLIGIIFIEKSISVRPMYKNQDIFSRSDALFGILY